MIKVNSTRKVEDIKQEVAQLLEGQLVLGDEVRLGPEFDRNNKRLYLGKYPPPPHQVAVWIDPPVTDSSPHVIHVDVCWASGGADRMQHSTMFFIRTYEGAKRAKLFRNMIEDALEAV